MGAPTLRAVMRSGDLEGGYVGAPTNVLQESGFQKNWLLKQLKTDYFFCVLTVNVFKQVVIADICCLTRQKFQPTLSNFLSTIVLYQTLVHAYGHIYIIKFLKDGGQRSANILMVSIIKI